MQEARNITMMGRKRSSLKTLNLNSAQISGIPCSINGLVSCTIFGWAKNLAGPLYAPSWLESPRGWGGTYFSQQSSTRMDIRFGSGSNQSNKKFNFSPQPDTWYHYCFTRDGSGSTGLYTFYLNGLAVASLSGNKTALQRNANSFTLANGLLGYVVNTDESIVAYGVFSRALSSSEVAQMYALKLINTTKPPFNNGLLMGLNVTEGKGNKIFDLVSGNYATISSTPNWNVDFPL